MVCTIWSVYLDHSTYTYVMYSVEYLALGNAKFIFLTDMI